MEKRGKNVKIGSAPSSKFLQNLFCFQRQKLIQFLETQKRSDLSSIGITNNCFRIGLPDLNIYKSVHIVACSDQAECRTDRYTQMK